MPQGKTRNHGLYHSVINNEVGLNNRSTSLSRMKRSVVLGYFRVSLVVMLVSKVRVCLAIEDLRWMQQLVGYSYMTERLESRKGFFSSESSFFYQGRHSIPEVASNFCLSLASRDDGK